GSVRSATTRRPRKPRAAGSRWTSSSTTWSTGRSRSGEASAPGPPRRQLHRLPRLAALPGRGAVLRRQHRELFFRYYRLLDEMQTQAQLAPSLDDGTIRRRIQAAAQDIGLPAQAQQIRIVRR